MKRSEVLVAAGVAAIVLVVAAGAAYLRFGRALDVPVVEAVQGKVILRVIGPGTLQARVPVTLSSRVIAMVKQLNVDTGDIVKRGQVLALLDDRDLAARHSGFIFQQHNLIRFLTAIENVALVLQLNGIRGREATRRAKELLGYLEIAHRADSLPANLSGGEQQRVAIGRALANEPPLILADEPTAALDTERGHKVMALLKKIARERRSAVITVTHDHRMIEGFDTVYHLDDGVLVRVPQAQAA